MKIKYKEFLNACTPYEDDTKRWYSEYNTDFFENFFTTVYDMCYDDKIVMEKSIWFKRNNRNKCLRILLTLYDNGNFNIRYDMGRECKKIDLEDAKKYLDMYQEYVINLFRELYKLNLLY